MTGGHMGAVAGAAIFAGLTFLAGAAAEGTVRIVAVAAAQEMVDADLVKRGVKLARRSGCAACHSLDGSRRPGPTWKGLYGSKRPLANGQEVIADEAYLRRSILEPDAEIAQGFPKGMMPKNFAKKLSEDKVRALVELMKSVR